MALDEIVDLANAEFGGDVDLAFRYKHGWIKIKDALEAGNVDPVGHEGLGAKVGEANRAVRKDGDPFHIGDTSTDTSASDNAIQRWLKGETKWQQAPMPGDKAAASAGRKITEAHDGMLSFEGRLGDAQERRAAGKAADALGKQHLKDDEERMNRIYGPSEKEKKKAAKEAVRAMRREANEVASGRSAMTGFGTGKTTAEERRITRQAERSAAARAKSERGQRRYEFSSTPGSDVDLAQNGSGGSSGWAKVRKPKATPPPGSGVARVKAPAPVMQPKRTQIAVARQQKATAVTSKALVRGFKKSAGVQGAGLGNKAQAVLKARAAQPGHYRAKAILAAQNGNVKKAKMFEAKRAVLHAKMATAAKPPAAVKRPAAPAPAVKAPVVRTPAAPAAAKVPAAPKPPAIPKPKKIRVSGQAKKAGPYRG